MPLDAPIDRRLTPPDLARLVEAVRDADVREPETSAVEWKSTLDLDDVAVRFTLARHLLGFANRSVASAARSFEGFAYLLVGVSPGEVAGVEVADPGRLDDVSRYIAADRPDWALHLIAYEGKTVAVIEVPPPHPGGRIATLQRAYERVEPGRIFVRRPGKTVEASPDEVRMLEERFAEPSHESAAREATRHEAELRRLAVVEEERLAHELRDRAEARAARFIPSTRSPGLSLDAASSLMTGMLVNAGGAATVVQAILRPELGGAYPGGLAAVFGSRPFGDPLGRVRIDQGVDLLVSSGHAGLSALAGTVQPLTLVLWSVDDGGFETHRNAGAAARGRGRAGPRSVDRATGGVPAQHGRRGAGATGRAAVGQLGF